MAERLTTAQLVHVAHALCYADMPSSTNGAQRIPGFNGKENGVAGNHYTGITLTKNCSDPKISVGLSSRIASSLAPMAR